MKNLSALTLTEGNIVSIVSGIIKKGEDHRFDALSKTTQDHTKKMMGPDGGVLGFTLGYDEQSKTVVSLTIFKDFAAITQFRTQHTQIMSESEMVFEPDSVNMKRSDYSIATPCDLVPYISDLQTSYKEILIDKYAVHQPQVTNLDILWQPLTMEVVQEAGLETLEIMPETTCQIAEIEDLLGAT